MEGSGWAGWRAVAWIISRGEREVSSQWLDDCPLFIHKLECTVHFVSGILLSSSTPKPLSLLVFRLHITIFSYNHAYNILLSLNQGYASVSPYIHRYDCPAPQHSSCPIERWMHADMNCMDLGAWPTVTGALNGECNPIFIRPRLGLLSIFLLLRSSWAVDSSLNTNYINYLYTTQYRNEKQVLWTCHIPFLVMEYPRYYNASATSVHTERPADPTIAIGNAPISISGDSCLLTHITRNAGNNRLLISSRPHSLLLVQPQSDHRQPDIPLYPRKLGQLGWHWDPRIVQPTTLVKQHQHTMFCVTPDSLTAQGQYQVNIERADKYYLRDLSCHEGR
jgi:hypothetical protein